MQLGSLKLTNNLMLAPLAGVTDMIFRVYAKRFGCGLVFSEMINSNSVLHGGIKMHKKMHIHAEEFPAGIQLAGDDPTIMSEAAKMAEDAGAAILNINMGCPAKKVTKSMAGCALMQHPDLVRKIIRNVSDATQLPLTIKIRLGWDDKTMNYLEIAKIAEGEGCVGLMMHARTRMDRFSGEAKWDEIRNLKENIRIPVIGNGDVTSVQKALELFQASGCDGIMIGRGACGKPWIFKQILDERDNRTPYEPSISEIKNHILNHLDESLEYYGYPLGLVLMRKHFTWYTQGLSYSREFRHKIQTEMDLVKVKKLIHEYFDEKDLQRQGL
ncbi:MAG: tRNA dihydrouridine synthase DusB [Deltaproteobacteria bacterium]|nr:tRNA dihydrouridine synthase DusB [Deltaproteobacteria bacterium]